MNPKQKLDQFFLLFNGFYNYDKIAIFYFPDQFIFFEAKLFESMYFLMIGPARQGVVHERVESERLLQKVDMYDGWDFDFAVRNAGNHRMWADLFKWILDD